MPKTSDCPTCIQPLPESWSEMWTFFGQFFCSEACALVAQDSRRAQVARMREEGLRG